MRTLRALRARSYTRIPVMAKVHELGPSLASDVWQGSNSLSAGTLPVWWVCCNNITVYAFAYSVGPVFCARTAAFRLRETFACDRRAE
jgi:hypothetical protein